MPIVSPELLRKLLDYDPDSGLLVWKVRTPDLFSEYKNPKARCRQFNSTFAGKRAMYANTSRHGYLTGSIFGRQYLAHRVVWVIVNGVWPDCIDHINGDRTDNRISNLRSVRKSENARNSARSKRNKSGIIGIYWAHHAGKWRAEICSNGSRIHLGYFSDKSDAAAARKNAEAKCGFHPNHGRSA